MFLCLKVSGLLSWVLMYSDVIPHIRNKLKVSGLLSWVLMSSDVIPHIRDKLKVSGLLSWVLISSDVIPQAEGVWLAFLGLNVLRCHSTY